MADKTLEEMAGNGDGTYRMTGLVQFMYEISTGKPLSEEEAQKIVDEGVAKAKQRREAK